MFTNATVFELYARARHDGDLLASQRPQTLFRGRSLRRLLRASTAPVAPPRLSVPLCSR